MRKMFPGLAAVALGQALAGSSIVAAQALEPAQPPTPAQTPTPAAAAAATPAPTATEASALTATETAVPADAGPPAATPTPVAAASPALSEAPIATGVFTVGDIRVEGLQRISEGTVFNYLPVNIGDKLDSQRLGESLRALYATGFFRDVELRREGNTLLVVVIERPSIASFELKGNKDIKTEDLQKSLRNVGLAQGKTFDRSVLEEVKQYLTDQYYSRGKYAVRVETKVTDLPGNKVSIVVDIKEGKRARIRQINLVGDTKFKEKAILSGFELKTPNWLSWYKQDDRYSRESLQGDLEKLRSHYMDRGYANFQIESTQVAIDPDKQDMFITVNVNEGEVFKVAEVKLAGNMVVPEAVLKQLILVKPGDTFSRKAITSTQELISYRLGEDGYAFAKIDPVPTPDNDKRTVALTFFIEPGSRVYVRHINFNNASAINDETLRREMRQLEGAWLSNRAVERSKERIQRLPFVEKVEQETKPVAGSPDLVDVDFEIKEGLPGQFGGGIGYSESQSFSLNGNFVHSNFLGRGERIAVELNSGRFSKNYSFSHTNPYTTVDGVARTASLSFRDITQYVSASSRFSTKQITGAVQYGYPITEYQGVQWGVAVNQSELVTSQGNSAQQAVNWVRSNGNPYDRVIGDTNGDGFVNSLDTPYSIIGSKFKTFELTAGWSYDSRNRALFADRGMRNSLSIRYALPLSDVKYYVASWDFVKYLPIWRSWTAVVNFEYSYGSALGSTTALPPYLNFFGGGPDSVRGFRESRLGPKDNIGQGNPYGGNFLVVNRAEIIFPVPEKWRSAARISWFFDVGNVFQTGGKVAFRGRDGLTPVNYRFGYDKLKRSTGLAVQWLAPLGLFRFSYGIPLNAKPGDSVNFEDEQERFQFSIGQAF